MAFNHGKSSVIYIDNAAGTPVDVSSYLSSFSCPRMQDTAETTTFLKSNKTKLAGVGDGSASAEGKWDPTIHAQLVALFGLATTTTIKWYPAGVTGGSDPYVSCEFIITNYDPSVSVDDAAGFSAEFEATGDPTYGSD